MLIPRFKASLIINPAKQKRLVAFFATWIKAPSCFVMLLCRFHLHQPLLLRFEARSSNRAPKGGKTEEGRKRLFKGIADFHVTYKMAQHFQRINDESYPIFLVEMIMMLMITITIFEYFIFWEKSLIYFGLCVGEREKDKRQNQRISRI